MTMILAREASRDRNPSDQPEHGGLAGIRVGESTRQLRRRAARLVLDPHFVPIDQARKERIEELLRIAGDRSAQVTIGTQRSWCRQPRAQALSSYRPSHHDCERKHP